EGAEPARGCHPSILCALSLLRSRSERYLLLRASLIFLASLRRQSCYDNHIPRACAGDEPSWRVGRTCPVSPEGFCSPAEGRGHAPARTRRRRLPRHPTVPASSAEVVGAQCPRGTRRRPSPARG